MTVKGFDSLDAMFEYMAEQERLANERMTDSQRYGLKPGSYWVSPGPDGLLIFGHAYDAAEYVNSELDATPEDESIEYYGSRVAHGDFLRGQFFEDWHRGYMFGRAYSVWESDGELGSTHKANAYPIPASWFELARNAGWRAEFIRDPNGFSHLVIAGECTVCGVDHAEWKD